MNIFITGVAGFIGFHTTLKFLLSKNNKVFGIDNLNDYYDTKLKKDRLKILKENKKFFFKKIDLCDQKKLESFFSKSKPSIVVHLAAQAGVRYSISNPKKYLESNLIGFFNILDLSKNYKVRHFVFASTSSVYGSANKFPLGETLSITKPLSFYAATKVSNEVMSYAYSNIFKLPISGLRFFTVYGPYGRPDMSLHMFTKAIFENRKISLFNHGKHDRDFTYIDDIVEGIFRISKKPSNKKIPFEVFNIGNGKARKLKDFLSLIEMNLGKKAKINNLPLQKGDVLKTHADTKKLSRLTKYRAKTNIKVGIKKFIEWYKDYYS